MDSRAKQLRDLMRKGIVVAPGAFNPIVARFVEQFGFPAVYISGAGLSNSLALRDEGYLSRAKVLSMSNDIISAIAIPAIVDVDTGFGGPRQVAETLKRFEAIGAAAVQIEDQDPRFKRCGHLPGTKLISKDRMVKKVEAAVAAKNDPGFLIIARTDARAVEGLEGALARAKSYEIAGADVIFPEALESEEEFKIFRKEIRAPLLANMTEEGKSPSLPAMGLGYMGYNIVIFPQTAFRGMMKEAQYVLEYLKKSGTQRGLGHIGKLMSRAEIDKLLIEKQK